MVGTSPSGCRKPSSRWTKWLWQPPPAGAPAAVAGEPPRAVAMLEAEAPAAVAEVVGRGCSLLLQTSLHEKMSQRSRCCAAELSGAPDARGWSRRENSCPGLTTAEAGP